MVDPGKSHKPLALFLVLGQILSAFFVAWFLDWRSNAKSNHLFAAAQASSP
jgi:hypothetical protein